MATAKRRTPRRKGGKGKIKGGRGRNRFLIVLLFLGTASALVLAIPGSGFTAGIRTFLWNGLGFLSILIPLFLFQTAAWLMNLGIRRLGFRILSGIAVTGYFFTALLDMTISRLSPAFHNVPGGTIAGSISGLLVPVTGAPIAYLILFTAFVASLVAFTGWDLSRDIQTLAHGISRLWKAVFGGRRDTTRKKVPRQSKDPEPVPDPSNVWGQSRDETTVTELPFEPAVPEIEAEPPRPRNKVRRSAASPVRSPKTSGKSGSGRAGVEGSSETHSLPPLSSLDLPSENSRGRVSKAVVDEQAKLLVEKLADFDIDCKVVSTHPGPVITRFEVAPGAGIKVNRFVSLSDDLALALRARRIRILAPIPGKGAVGIEVPNRHPETVYLREIMENVESQILPIALGRKIEGAPFVADICSMPHLLIAGATGSGKSVCIHSIIASILLTRRPSEVRIAMVDPKMLELSIYQGIPHLWAPVVLETRKTGMLLDALVGEMEKRYQRLARTGVRSISEFNSRLSSESEDERIPYIILFIDELADLMMTLSNEVEPQIARLAQMARAVGIHLVLATQRPSVDVITGVIKANFPSRIAFNVQSKTDSRTILDMNGAEKLLGKGDMLFLPAASPEPMRIHGSFISTEETRTIVDHLKDQPPVPFEFDFPDDEVGNLMDPTGIKIDDPLFEKAKQVVITTQQGSVSIIQRRLRVGYSRAASLIDMLEQAGVVGPFQGSKAREVLVTLEEMEALRNGNEEE